MGIVFFLFKQSSSYTLNTEHLHYSICTLKHWSPSLTAKSAPEVKNKVQVIAWTGGFYSVVSVQTTLSLRTACHCDTAFDSCDGWLFVMGVTLWTTQARSPQTEGKSRAASREFNKAAAITFRHKHWDSTAASVWRRKGRSCALKCKEFNCDTSSIQQSITHPSTVWINRLTTAGGMEVGLARGQTHTQISSGDSSPASRNFRKISDDAPLMRPLFQHIFLFSGGGGCADFKSFLSKNNIFFAGGHQTSEAAPPLARRKRAYSTQQGVLRSSDKYYIFFTIQLDTVQYSW